MQVQNHEDFRERSISHWQNTFVSYLKENPSKDGAHDLSHFHRVWNIAKTILQSENAGNPVVVLAACYFHDIVSLPKNHPQRSQSSRLAKIKAMDILKTMNFPEELLEPVGHAIEAHSYSARIPPETLDAKIVQDADRIEALGYIGIARTFYVSGAMNRPLFDPMDPLAAHRNLDDTQFGLDHFQTKLLRLHLTMKTQGGRTMAKERTIVMERFLEGIVGEIEFQGEAP